MFGSRAIKDGRSVQYETGQEIAESLRAMASAALLSVAASASEQHHSVGLRRVGRQ